MPLQGSILGDVLEQGGEHLKKGLKEIASAPVDIVKASFEQPIPNPSAERAAQIKSEEKAKLAKVRSGLAIEQEIRTAPPEQTASSTGSTTCGTGKNKSKCRNE